jgi:hypothetical protein
MSSFTAEVQRLDQNISGLQTRILGVTPASIVGAALGHYAVYGCKVIGSTTSPLNYFVTLTGDAAGDEAMHNPNASEDPLRPYQFPNMASLLDASFFSVDLQAEVEAAPATSTARYDIAVISVGPNGAAFQIISGTPGASVKTDYDMNGLDTAPYGEATITDPVLPAGAMPVARIYVEDVFAGISNAQIADIRVLESRLIEQFTGVAQPLDAALTSISALTITANSLLVGSGADAFNAVSFAASTFPARSSSGDLAAKPITDFALTVLDDVDAAAVRTTLSAQGLDATLTALSGLTISGNSLIHGTGADAFAVTTYASNTFPARSGAGSLEAKAITDFALGLLDDTDGATFRTSAGLGTGDSPQFTGVQVGHATDTTITRASAGVIAVEGVNVLLASNIGGSVQAYSSILQNTTASFLTAHETKLGHISVTQAVDLDAIETRVNALDAAVVLRGSWDASGGTFPGSGTAQAGDSWIVSVTGTVDSVPFAVNDRVIAITDNASTGTYASNWFKADYTDQVQSVAGRTGAVTLVQADITGLTTADVPQFAGVQVGHVSDTTISRVSAGVIAVEGSNVLMASNVGTVVQGYDATLAAFAALTISANSLIHGTGADAFAVTTYAENTFPARSSAGNLEAKAITDFALTLLDDADGATFRTSAGLGTGDTPQFTGVQIGHASDTTITRTSAGVIAVEGNNVLMASNVGSSVQAWDAQLDSLSSATDVGVNLATVANPGAVRFIRINADNSVTLRAASDFLADIGGSGGGGGTFGGVAASTAEFLTGSNIASASTVDLDAATGNRVHITGTTTITAVTLTRGPRTVIFDGILTLTHHATNNNLPGQQNITTAAGDRAMYESDGTTVWCTAYHRAAASPLPLSNGLADGAIPIISGNKWNTTIAPTRWTMQNGSVTSPSLSFLNANTSGLWVSDPTTLEASAGGVRAMQFTTVASAVNYLSVAPSATGNRVTLTAKGSDTNVGIDLVTKGTGTVTVNGAAIGGASGAPAIQAKTANYTVVAGDANTIISVTSNSVTISFTAAATLGATFQCWVQNDATTSSHAVTIDPNGSETIDGKASIVLQRGQGVLVICDGTNLITNAMKKLRGYSENIHPGSTLPVASGSGALAMGISAIASTNGSLAIGQGATATGPGGGSFAWGPLATASGSGAIAISQGYNYGPGATASAETAVAMGDGVLADAACAWALGRASRASVFGKLAYASGSFGGNEWDGDAQTGKFVLRASTTSGTPAVLTSDGAAASATNQVILPNDSTCAFIVLLVARRTDANDESAGYKIDGVIDRNGSAATTALVGVPVVTVLGEDTSAWDVAVTANTTNGGLTITVTGEAAKTIRWVATVITSEVSG